MRLSRRAEIGDLVNQRERDRLVVLRKARDGRLALDEDFAEVVAREVHFDAGEIVEDALDERVGEELVGGAAAALLDAEGAVILDAVVAGGDGLGAFAVVKESEQ